MPDDARLDRFRPQPPGGHQPSSPDRRDRSAHPDGPAHPDSLARPDSSAHQDSSARPAGLGSAARVREPLPVTWMPAAAPPVDVAWQPSPVQPVDPAWEPPTGPPIAVGRLSGGAELPPGPSPAPTTTWDEWSHAHRDRRERAALTTRIRGDRGTMGLLHAQAVIVHRALVWRAASATFSTVAGFGFLWFKVISAREEAIARGLGARGFAPGGFLLLLLTVLAAVVLLRMWRSVYRIKVDPLLFLPLPDSPEAPRHGAFDGTAQPPTRW